MRISTLTFAIALAVPAGALALSYSDSTTAYKDASSFSRAEKAGISVLTTLGVVSGNDNGTFEPGRTLNRAEFAKIALLLSNNIQVIESDAENCFPDVRTSDWFSKYVCLAKKRGIVKGYPDGKFHPERAVNYVEAIKILSVTFYFSSAEQPGDQWYSQYLRASQEAKVLLPMNLSYDAALTRGQMARLGAAYRAYMEGELALYRQAETGKVASSMSSSKARFATCPDGYQYQTVGEDGSTINYFADPCLTHQLSSSSSSRVSSSSPSSSSLSALFPSISHLITAGAPTPPLLNATFVSPDEEADIRFVTVTLRREVKSLSGLILIDATGKELGVLKLSLDDSNYRIWKGEYASGGYRLPKNVPVTLGIKGTLKKDSITSAELFETEDFRVQVLGLVTRSSLHLVPSAQHFPNHQIALSRIQSVKNALAPTGILETGLRRQIASFAFSGSVVTQGGSLKLEELTFKLETTGVALSSFKVGGSSEIQQADCGIDPAAPQTLSCSLIPEAVNSINGTRMVSVFANVTALSGSTVPTLQVTLQSPGTMNVTGAIRWTDGSGRFNWIEGTAPIAAGTKWTVVK